VGEWQGIGEDDLIWNYQSGPRRREE